MPVSPIVNPLIGDALPRWVSESRLCEGLDFLGISAALDLL